MAAPMSDEEYQAAMDRADAAIAEVEAEMGYPPPVKPPVVRLQRQITERREAERAEREARLQRIREESMVPLNDEGDVLYTDVLPTRATAEDLADHFGGSGPDLFGDDDMLDTDAGHHRGGTWPE